ncbi:arsenate reductase ArsC [Sphingomonas sp. SORGH_AS_0438]|jgi:arsenate reductase|uniref:arsenate reductase ArsC n=1 Tax=Sphingomonas sp. SORGH_AS_0438 TaxID=3041756 RepID=UPI00286194FA|nr:arsenate reductase ArsC [Sphingomonas sp. SORGH_AS_0438]MDR6129095.1 arsenate reductase [Sphingomonas sp. SORGH_AS_0438]
MSHITNVLVLCTGNSARSILGEAIVNRLGQGRFRGFSAGSAPKGQVHPGALRLLARHGYPTDDLRSKSWDEFADGKGPSMDIVITVCDNAGGEVCPVWTGTPIKAHWGLPDPAAVTGDDATVDAAFEATHDALTRRIAKLVELPIHNREVPAMAVRQRLQDIHDQMSEQENADMEHRA